MKPKDLKSPFSWEERRVLLQDGVLYVPDYYTRYNEFTLPSWRELFGNDHPVHIEYCSGNGHWMIERALTHPQINWVGVEWRFERIRKIWSKRQNMQLTNLFLICGEALTATQHYFATESCAELYVNFPDPWPKAKHAKYRLLAPPFIAECGRILYTNGGVTLVTDDIPYRDEMIQHFLAHPDFISEYPAPYYRTDIDNYGHSTFGALWESLGRPAHHMRFVKR